MGGLRFVLPVLAGLGVGVLAAGMAHARCGDVVTLDTDDGTTTRYSLAGVKPNAAAALVLLPGGGGFLNLDDDGCPRELKGNSLVRKREMFHEAGMITALVDARSDHQGTDGLGGLRVAASHARDIGKVIADVRRRTGLPVWLLGTSRGAISAANAASRLTGDSAPDGVVLTSPVTSGREGGFKAWVADTVFSSELDKVRMPVLVVVHGDDKCVRTPPELGPDILEKTEGAREQAVTVTGGPGWRGGTGLKACRGRSPHGFIGQEAEVAAGMVRFIRGGRY